MMEKANKFGSSKSMISIFIFMIGIAIAPLTIGLAIAADIFWQGDVGGNMYAPSDAQNVGIGTAAPKAKLHVSNGAFLVEGDQGTIEGLANLGTGNRLMWIPSLAAFRVGRIDNQGFTVVNGAESYFWALSNIGEESIGLGTDTLASKLGSIAIGFYANSSGEDSISIGGSSQAVADGSVAIGPWAQANQLRSIAIGFFSQANAADSIAIGNSVKNTFSKSLVVGFSTQTPSLFVDRYGTIFNGVPQQGAPRYTMAVNGNASINGNLLLGVTAVEAGTHKIAVRGSIKAEEIVVATTWADYVFNENYALPPLSEVAAYIKKNKRLPEIPTGTQIEREGLKMADMMALQMKKIEELTLYAIELKKENETLKAELCENRKDLLERLQVLETALSGTVFK